MYDVNSYGLRKIQTNPYAPTNAQHKQDKLMVIDWIFSNLSQQHPEHMNEFEIIWTFVWRKKQPNNNIFDGNQQCQKKRVFFSHTKENNLIMAWHFAGKSQLDEWFAHNLMYLKTDPWWQNLIFNANTIRHSHSRSCV